MTARGVRNNNPGNLRASGAPWLGKLSPSGDPAFEQFDTPEHGIRALAKVLLAYYRTHGLDTIGAIIGRWAPASENDTAAYVEHVCGRCGVSADQPIDLTVPDTLAAVTEAVISHENGTCPYTVAQIDAGVTMALTPRQETL